MKASLDIRDHSHQLLWHVYTVQLDLVRAKETIAVILRRRLTQVVKICDVLLIDTLNLSTMSCGNNPKRKCIITAKTALLRS